MIDAKEVETFFCFVPPSRSRWNYGPFVPEIAAFHKRALKIWEEKRLWKTESEDDRSLRGLEEAHEVGELSMDVADDLRGRRHLRAERHAARVRPSSDSPDPALLASGRRKQYGSILDCINRRNTESGIDLCLKGEI